VVPSLAPDPIDIVQVYALYKCGNTLYRWKVPLLAQADPPLSWRFVFPLPFLLWLQSPNTSFNKLGMGIVFIAGCVIGKNCTRSPQHVTIAWPQRL